jgi:cysteine synthase
VLGIPPIARVRLCRAASQRSRIGRGFRTVGTIALLTLVSVIVAGCGAPATAANASDQLSRGCEQATAVLADGPSSTVDPVGYALAQIRPLRGIRTSDAALQKVLSALTQAYAAVYETNDGKSASAAVSVASKKLDAICSGASS